ncbi:MAG: hypothetical protein KZQ89_01520, partial [Candidatus Thiodiazotropha sp. (ex Lucinoma kastoroae)]|nr:hypothetical protein [Candidatus Thiodiazotropha sp. (ex Lucinoma kastoroae)]
MINKFEIAELLEIKTASDFETREKYKFDVDPSKTKLVDVIAYYDIQNEEIHCGLSNCHQPHHMGYLVKTSDGSETNIGNYCGRNHFGNDFAIQKNVFMAERRLQNYRKLLNEVVYNSNDIFSHIDQLKQQGANWLNKSLTNIRRSFPQRVVTQLQDRAVKGNDIIYVDRERTSEELEIAKEVNPSANIESLLRILLIMNTDSGDREHSPWPRIGFSVFLTQ